MAVCSCGATFKPPGHGRPQKFCSAPCYMRNWRANHAERIALYETTKREKRRRPNGTITAVCQCGATFQHPAIHTGNPRKYCTPECRTRDKTRRWRLANPEKTAMLDAKQDEKRRQQNAAHPELSKEKEKARYAANRDGHRARVKAYREANRDHVNARQRALRVENPERYRAYVKKWQKTHPEAVAHHIAAWRARRRGNGGHHTLAEWRAKRAAYQHRCAYCGEEKRLTRDHDLPLSRGGTDDIANIIPACRLCNSKKRHRTAAEYLALSA